MSRGARDAGHGDDDADVVVIGGGITGCSTAYHLARRGVRVVLCEAGDIGHEQSSRAWGFVRRQGRHPAELPLAIEAAAGWERLTDELGAEMEYTRGGIVALGESDADVQKLEEGAATAREHGLSTRLVGPRELEALLPGLRGRWRVGLYTPDDGHASPARATRAFGEAARRAGADVRTRSPVLEVDLVAGRAAGVVTARSRVRAGAVVCAGGVHVRRLVRALGVSIPTRIVRSSVGETRRGPAGAPSTAVWAPGVAFRPTPGGTYVIGNGYRGTGADLDVTIGTFEDLRHFLPTYLANWRRLRPRIGAPFVRDLRERLSGADAPRAHSAWLAGEPAVNARKVIGNARRLEAMLPSVRGLGVERMWAGRIDMTPDLIPAIGELHTAPGVYVAAGFSGHGFALGPVTGRLLAELVVDGRASLDLAAFDPHRFRSGPVAARREAL